MNYQWSVFHADVILIWDGFYVILQNLLAETEEPLSFTVFIPDWRDPPTEALLRLESSR